ncbi:MAG: TetR/AcrR family transcriptional regulator [Dehalococcoidia bacterium]|nr:TetR/AcrR family transcriptional regulator [Dehalococcoidia bacterium]
MKAAERIKEQKREAILRQAQEQFATHGFEKVSVSEIAAGAHVSPATIYNHFGTKDNLAREVIRQLLLSLLQRYRGIVESELPFPEKLVAIVFDKAEIAGQYRGELLRTAYEGNQEMRELVDNLWRTEFNRLTEDLFEQGKRQGHVNRDTSHEALLLYLDIVRKGIFASSAELSATAAHSSLIRELNFLILYGLLGKEPGR